MKKFLAILFAAAAVVYVKKLYQERKANKTNPVSSGYPQNPVQGYAHGWASVR